MKDRIFKYCDRRVEQILNSMMDELPEDKRDTPEDIKEAFDGLSFFVKLKLVGKFFKVIPFALVSGFIIVILQ